LNTASPNGRAELARFSVVIFFDAGDFLDLDDVDFARAFALVTLPASAVSDLILFATA
jgi:hypothetical protein